VEVGDERTLHRFEAGGAYLLGGGVGEVRTRLCREAGVEVYALFVADFFLQAYATAEWDDPFGALKTAVAQCRGVTPLAGLGPVLSPRSLALLTDPAAWEGAPGPTAVEKTLAWLNGRMRVWHNGRDERDRRLVGHAVDAALSALPRVLSLAELAARCGVGEGRLKRAFREAVGESPGRHLRRRRLQRAYEMLKDGHGVRETAQACGYAHAGHFAALFRACYGVSPSQMTKT
jgi:AraC-like DNA-binding protein